MPTRPRFAQFPRSALLTLPVMALALSLAPAAVSHGAEFGRARVLSAQGSTLNVTLPLTGLSSEDDRTLRVRLADLESWSRAGLRPPARLGSMRAELDPAPGKILPGQSTRQRILRITSSEPSNSPTVDLLLVLETGTGSRLVQFSVLFPQPGLSRPSSPTSPAVGERARAAAARPVETQPGAARRPGPGSLVVRAGQTLSEVAQANPVQGADYYQRLVAIWQANPDAFIENNMNLVRSGQRLRLPDAATVRAVDPAQARRIYQEQLDAHAAYRARMAGSAASASAVAGVAGNRGQVDAGGDAALVPPGATGERLRLSAGESSDAEGDRQTAEKSALDDAAGRVEQLNRNIDELNRLSQAAGGGQVGGLGASTATSSAGGAASEDSARPDAGTLEAAKSAAAAGTTGSEQGRADAAATGKQAGTERSGNAATPAALGAAGSAVPGVSSTARADDGVNNSGDSSFMASSGLPAWLTDNLLIVVTAILAIIAFIIAWAVRRAAARNENDTGEDDESSATMDPALIDKRLSAIDLDLDTPPPDEGVQGERRRP